MTIDADQHDGRKASSSNAIAGILAWLNERKLQPGDKLPSERDFAERLSLSRNTVREALATLVTLRMVESRPNSGIYLRHYAKESSFEAMVMLTEMGATPSTNEVSETMEVRAHLELLALGLACTRRTDADIAHLEEIQKRTEKVLNDGGNIAVEDTQFHIALAEATQNSVLVRVLNAFYQLTAGRRSVLFQNHAQGEASAKEHRLLLKYVKDQNADKAQKLILSHMDRARKYWSQVLEESSKRR